MDKYKFYFFHEKPYISGGHGKLQKKSFSFQKTIFCAVAFNSHNTPQINALQKPQKDRLNLRPGCAPSSPDTEPILGQDGAHPQTGSARCRELPASHHSKPCHNAPSGTGASTYMVFFDTG